MGQAVLAAAQIVGPLEGFDKFLSALISGLALGAIYATLALGFVIIFKATQVVNFAHGAIAALGAYFVVYFATVLNFPGRLMEGAPLTLQWALSAALAILATGVVGLVVERLTLRPMVGEPLFSVAIITIGLEVIIRTTNNDLLGNQLRGLGDPWGSNVFEWGVQRVPQTQVVQVGVVVVVMLFLAMFFRTRVGLAMRATAFDQEAAMAQGISVGRIFALAWAIGAALAAVGGIFASVFPRSPGVDPFTPFVVFRAFPAVIVGGLDSVSGAVAGGFIIGLAEVFAGKYVAGAAPGWMPWETWGWLGTGFSGIVPWLVMLIVLLVRPYGLFGTEEIRRV